MLTRGRRTPHPHAQRARRGRSGREALTACSPTAARSSKRRRSSASRIRWEWALPVEAQQHTAAWGEAIRALMDAGVRALSRSASSSTNDGGAGLFGRGLGLKLFDAHKTMNSTPRAEPNSRVSHESTCRSSTRVYRARSSSACRDRRQSAYRRTTAQPRYSSAKGVKPEQVATLDAARRPAFADLLEPALGPHGARTARRGCCPAASASHCICSVAKFEPGAETVAGANRPGRRALKAPDWLITGEGRSDVADAACKAPSSPARHAQAAGVPATLLSGGVDSAALPRLAEYFSGCFSPGAPARSRSKCRDSRRRARLLADEAEQLTAS
ncbi:glycerate kinase [Paraburkholderia dipogonis]|uniref:glycerate kinase n=1 Tax=Paraburkholderia dipogonis TaxID=1211383 RepID=UPI0035F00E18